MVRITGFLLLMLLQGCAQTVSRSLPTWPAPPSWLLVKGETERVSAVHWRTFFTDSQLQGIVDLALKNNRDLRIAAARVAEAKAQFGGIKASSLPTLALGAGIGVYKNTQSSGVAGSPERYDLSATLTSFEPDFWGRYADMTEASKQQLLSTEAARRVVQAALIADVVNGYFGLLEAIELRQLAEDNFNSQQQSLELVAKGREIGAIDEFQYHQALAVTKSARSSIELYSHQAVVVRNRLAYLTGNSVFQIQPAGRLREQKLSLDIKAGMSSEVLLNRPDVIAAEHRLAAANANVDVARKAYLPRLALTAGMGFASSGLLNLFNGSMWSFQPLLSLPLFDGGKNAANVESFEARSLIAVAEYERTIQLAFREVADLLSAQQALAIQFDAASTNLQLELRRQKVSRVKFNAGLIAYGEVLESDRAVLSASQVTTQLRRAQIESAVQLYKSLGGGA